MYRPSSLLRAAAVTLGVVLFSLANVAGQAPISKETAERQFLNFLAQTDVHAQVCDLAQLDVEQCEELYSYIDGDIRRAKAKYVQMYLEEKVIEEDLEWFMDMAIRRMGELAIARSKGEELAQDQHHHHHDHDHFHGHDMHKVHGSQKPAQGVAKQVNGPCVNMDFESCNFNGWDLFEGEVNANPLQMVNSVGVTGGAQHTIMTAGTDALVGIPTTNPNGGSCSVMLGDATGTGGLAASMTQTFLVDPTNAVFTYSYALVLEDPSGHTVGEKPFFKVNMYDQNGNGIACGDYQVIAGDVNSGGDPDFVAYNGGFYLPWRTTFAPLQNYIGQNVTIEFIIGDCSQSGHYGYGYIDAQCSPLDIIASDTAICGNSTVTLTAPDGAASYLWNTGETTQEIQTNTPGNYSVEVTPVTGANCAITLNITVQGSPGEPIADFSMAPNPICPGDQVTFTDLSTTTLGAVINSWQWDFGDGNTSTLQHPNHTFATAGNYNVLLTVATAGGCTDTLSQVLTVNPQADATVTPAGPFCASDAPFTMTAVDPGGTWTATCGTCINATTGDFDPSIALAGNHDITYIISGSCGDSSTVAVSVQTVTIDNIALLDPLCFQSCDGSITVTATGATEYSIDNGGTWQASGTFTNQCAGTYDVLVRNALGCTATQQVVLSDPPQLTIQFSNFDNTCNNACDGYAIVIPSGGTSPYTFNWSNGAASNLAQNDFLCAGTYSLEVLDANNCQVDTNNWQISEPLPFNIATSSINANCNQDDGSATVDNVNGQTAPYTYSWDAAAGSQNTATASNLYPGTYDVTILDANLCDTVIVVTVGNNPGHVAQLVNTTDVTCHGGNDGAAEVTANGGTPPYTYSWDAAAANQSTAVASNLSAGTYSCTITDANGCTDTISATINEPTPVLANITPDTTICIGGTATLVASAAGGTGPNYTFQWDDPGQSTTTSIVVNPNGQTVYTLLVADANGCPSNAIATTVDLYPPLSVTAFTDTAICIGSTATIDALASGGIGTPYTYTWDQGIGTGQNHAVSPSTTTVYTVTAADACETPDAQAQVTITVNRLPEPSFSADVLEGCMPVTTTFTNMTDPFFVGNNCWWDFGDGSASVNDCGTPTYTFTDPGCYDVTLTVTSPQGCTADTTIADYICVHDFPNADFVFGPQPTTYLNPNIDFTDQSTNPAPGFIVDYVWEFDELGTDSAQHPSFEFPSNDAGDYDVCLTVTNNYGCADTYCDVVVIDGEMLVYVPNAFTPDGDGVNDLFFAEGFALEKSDDFTMYIFNRWGELIWESHNATVGWDGTAKGQKVQTDVYVWKVIVRDPYNGNKLDMIGHVTVLR